MVARLLLFLGLLSFPFILSAQTYKITAHVADSKDNSALIGVAATITVGSDSLSKNGAVSDANGDIVIENVAPGNYKFNLKYIGYKSIHQTITVTTGDVLLGTISMETRAKELKGVTISGKQIRAEQMGDTSQFHADAYKTNADASAEELVSKMPGVTSDNTGVKVNGEAVQQVMVDGKPFFGTDPTLALKNLPAEVIDKIQVFDKLSDQSNFTGFDDGNSQKTMNIITRKNKSEGVFGKLYAGYGTDDRYLAGGNINIFNGDQRISILGMANNVNQQNFSSQDLLGVSSGSGQNRGGGGGGGFGGSGYGGGGNSQNNFLIGQQGGIATTNSFGVNYSDNWGKKIKVSGSYFFNNTDNVNKGVLTRNYFADTGASSLYQENDNAESVNYNHRFNLRLEYNIDSQNTIIFTPGIGLQQNNTISLTSAGSSKLGDALSNIVTNNTAFNTGYSSSDNLLLQHKFKKPRRTISLNVSASLNEKSGNGTYNTSSYFYSPADSTFRDQHYTLYNNGSTISSNITYTEPIGKKGQLMFNYNPSYTKGGSDKETYEKPAGSNDYTKLDTAYSNKFSNTYTTQRGGMSYRIGDKKWNFSFGANVQQAILEGNQQFPYNATKERTFTDVLPNVFYNYRFADGRNLRVMYRTNINAPSVTQLQDVTDLSNPLLLKTGNSGLKQDYEQTFILRYGMTKSKTAHNFFLNLYINYIDNYIGNETVMPNYSTIFYHPVTNAPIFIAKGGQLTLPVNLDGYWNTRSFITYGIPVEFIKSNIHFMGGLNYTRTPGLVNSVTNYSDNYAPSFGIVLGSNISEKVDFTLSYNGNYNVVKNSIQAVANNNYYSHTASLRFNWIFLKNFVFNTNITNNYYAAFSGTGNQDYYLWNTYLGYKFLKNHALEARISVYDLLNQNVSVNRTVTETYIENNNTQVLKQYFMLQLTYTIRNFKGAMPTAPANEDHFRPGGRDFNPGNRDFMH